MSWLYDHRDQLDGCRRYAEIAYRFRPKVMSEDRDDIEQNITIKLKAVADKNDQVKDGYLWAVARNIVNIYWRKKYREKRRFCRLSEGDKGTIVDGFTRLIFPALDMDAPLDARAMLDTLPERLVSLGRKLADGDTITGADRKYLCKERHRRSKYLLADDEKIERMNQLYMNKGLNCAQIGRVVGMSRSGVWYHLDKQGILRH